jgi:hypothetical protein
MIPLRRDECSHPSSISAKSYVLLTLPIGGRVVPAHDRGDEMLVGGARYDTRLGVNDSQQWSAHTYN